MVLCQVQNGVLPIVRAHANSERFYQLSYADQRYYEPGFNVLH